MSSTTPTSGRKGSTAPPSATSPLTNPPRTPQIMSSPPSTTPQTSSTSYFPPTKSPSRSADLPPRTPESPRKEGGGAYRGGSQTRPNRGPSRAGSATSSMASLGTVLDASGRLERERGLGLGLGIGGAGAGEGDVGELGQNAISTLLQTPIVRTGLLPHPSSSASAAGYKAPTTRDIPPVTLPNIPTVDSSVFKNYLAQVSSLYETLQRVRAENEDATASQLPRAERESSGGKVEGLGLTLADGLSGRQKDEPANRGSPSKQASTDRPQLDRNRSSITPTRRDPTAVPPLSTVPSVYFDDNFHLENPRTFDIVSERSEVVRTPAKEGAANGSLDATPHFSRRTLANNAILQEKLSWYMDTVEMHLVTSISAASSSFFAALGSLRELQSEAADSVAKIKLLRSDLARLDREMAVGGLKIVDMKRRRQNLRRLSLAAEQLRRVVYVSARCEELVDQGALELGLDRIDDWERLIAGESDLPDRRDSTSSLGPPLPELIDLRGVGALAGVADDIRHLRHRVGRGFETRFLEALLDDVRQHVRSVPARETLLRWGSASQRARGDQPRKESAIPAYLSTSPQLRADMLSTLNGLSRADHVTPATNAFRDAVMREMKMLIRQRLPSSTDDDGESVASASTSTTRSARHAGTAQDKSAVLARNLRALDPDAAEELLAGMYASVGEALRRLGVQVKVLLDVTSGVTSPGSTPLVRSPPRTPNIDGSLNSALAVPVLALSPTPANLQEELLQTLDMSGLLGQAVDAAQTQITKILKVRAEQTVRLPLQRFLRYFTLNRLFADECEAVSGRSGAALKTVVNGHISEFVALLGEAEKQRLVQSMEADRWEAQDFGEAENALLARVVEGVAADPEAWTKGFRVWEDVEDQDAVAGAAQASSRNGTNGTTPSKEKVRSAILDEQRYMLVDSASAVLRSIDRLAHLTAVMPSIASDVASLLVDVLKLFNSRSCQLILGAGATRSGAGLKNINTKHLALASQALSFVVALIPYVREFFRRRLAGPASVGLLAEFEKVKRLYLDHQAGINDKLVDIMSGRAATHVAAMRKVHWDGGAAAAGADAQSMPVSPHMETLTKETSTLHRVLGKHLPEVSVRMIMDPVFDNYREQWGKAFEEAVVKTEAGKQRLLRDAELFDAKLSKIDGAGDIGTFILDIVKRKEVEAPAAPPAEASTDDSKDTPQQSGEVAKAENGATAAAE